jgi:hypothetical protein
MARTTSNTAKRGTSVTAKDKPHKDYANIEKWLEAQRKGEQPKLQRALDAITRLYSNAEKPYPFDWWHRVGSLIEQLYPKSQSRQRTYRANVIKLLADKLEPERGQQDQNLLIFLWRLREFVSKYTEQEAMELTRRRNAKGQPISAYHMTFLLSVHDRKAREDLLDKCLEESLSAGQLERLIQKRAGGRRGGGRRYRRPVGKLATMLQVDDMADRWLRWHKSLFERQGKEEESPLLKHLDPRLQIRLEQINDLLEEVQKAAKKVLARKGEKKGSPKSDTGI